MLWNLSRLNTVPRVFPARHHEAPGVRALFYEGEPARGRPTRVFAWYGAPRSGATAKLPAMVLVHGGGGTAFADWVRLWNDRGYAALAMDTCGGVPAWSESPYFQLPMWPRHAHSGPPGWGRYEEASRPPREQWLYHAVAAVVRGHSLLRSMPEVDPDRIGITGISWGGVLTCVAAGLDDRFRFAVPVYGCGFLKHIADVTGAIPAQRDRWLAQWDPAHFLTNVRRPVLWVSGTNDGAFPLDTLQRSYRLPAGERTLAIRVRMIHGHGGAGERPEEIRVYADAQVRRGRPLPQVRAQGRDGRTIWVEWSAETPVRRVEFNFTRATGHWTDRFWNTWPATIDPAGTRASIVRPRGCTVSYFNLVDDRDCVASTEHVVL